MASPPEEGAASLKMFLPVPAKQAKELRCQEPVGQTGLLNQIQVLISVPIDAQKPFHAISQIPPQRGLNHPDSGGATSWACRAPPPAFSLFSKQSTVSSSSCSVFRPCYGYEFRPEALTGSPRKGGQEWGGEGPPCSCRSDLLRGLRPQLRRVQPNC